MSAIGTVLCTLILITLLASGGFLKTCTKRPPRLEPPAENFAEPSPECRTVRKLEFVMRGWKDNTNHWLTEYEIQNTKDMSYGWVMSGEQSQDECGRLKFEVSITGKNNISFYYITSV